MTYLLWNEEPARDTGVSPPTRGKGTKIGGREGQGSHPPPSRTIDLKITMTDTSGRTVNETGLRVRSPDGLCDRSANGPLPPPPASPHTAASHTRRPNDGRRLPPTGPRTQSSSSRPSSPWPLECRSASGPYGVGSPVPSSGRCSASCRPCRCSSTSSRPSSSASASSSEPSRPPSSPSRPPSASPNWASSRSTRRSPRPRPPSAPSPARSCERSNSRSGTKAFWTYVGR